MTGATGKTGRHLTGELVRRGERVRAFVRDPAAAVAVLGPEVEIVAGDLDRTDILEAAMPGVDLLYPRTFAMFAGDVAHLLGGGAPS